MNRSYIQIGFSNPSQRNFLCLSPNTYWTVRLISPTRSLNKRFADLFDSRKVTFEDQHTRPQTPVVSSRTKVENWRANLTKRPHEDIEDSLTSIDLRPPKKPKLEPMPKPLPAATMILDSLPLLKTQKQQLSPPQSPPRRIDLARHRPHPICTVEAFKRRCKIPSYVIISLYAVRSLDGSSVLTRCSGLLCMTNISNQARCDYL